MATINTPAVQQPANTRTRRKILWWVGGILGGLILLLVAAFAAMLIRMNYVPADLDYSTTRLSEQGLFRGSYVTEPIKINQLHSWTLHVQTADGNPIDNAEIVVDGDMPQHGHGLPTQPQVTQNLGNGDYLVEGMKFQMGGWWVMEFHITANGQTDTVKFNLLLK